MQIYRSIPDKPPKTRAVIKSHDQYDGWTGKEPFGSIRRVGNKWVTACPASVELQERSFTTLGEAVSDLNRLMNKARRMGQLDTGANVMPSFWATPEGEAVIKTAADDAERDAEQS